MTEVQNTMSKGKSFLKFVRNPRTEVTCVCFWTNHKVNNPTSEFLTSDNRFYHLTSILTNEDFNKCCKLFPKPIDILTKGVYLYD